jgi:hypothetical protein
MHIVHRRSGTAASLLIRAARPYSTVHRAQRDFPFTSSPQHRPQQRTKSLGSQARRFNIPCHRLTAIGRLLARVLYSSTVQCLHPFILFGLENCSSFTCPATALQYENADEMALGQRCTTVPSPFCCINGLHSPGVRPYPSESSPNPTVHFTQSDTAPRATTL